MRHTRRRRWPPGVHAIRHWRAGKTDVGAGAPAPIQVVPSPLGDDAQSVSEQRHAQPKGGQAAAVRIKQLKDAGTACFKAKDFAAAYEHYSKAVNAAMESGHAEDIHVLFSNLCAVLLKGNKSDETLDAALGYAEHCCKAAQNWPKAYYRRGQALEAKHGAGCEAARGSYLEACRRCERRDKLMEAALVRCGGKLAAARIMIGADEDLLEEMTDVDDKRLLGAGLEELPQMQVKGDPSTGRREQKQMMAGLLHESVQAAASAEHQESIKHAIAATKLAAVLGEAAAASFAFAQLATAFVGLHDLRKAEAHARSALAIAGAQFPTSILMSAEHPLQPRGKGVEIPGLSHPCSSYSLKTQLFLLSTAYFTLGNVLAAKLQHEKAVKSYKHALRSIERLRACQVARPELESTSDSELHSHIGDQFSKQDMQKEATGEYELALTHARAAGDDFGASMARGKIQSVSHGLASCQTDAVDEAIRNDL